MTLRTSLIALAAGSLAACGGSYGVGSLPEIPVPTPNATTLAAAFSSATSTDGTEAFEQFRRDNAHLGRWAASVQGCANNYVDISPGRLVDIDGNRACAFDEFERQEIEGGIAVSFEAECPVADAEPGPDGEIASEPVAVQLAISDDLTTANISLDGVVRTMQSCSFLLAPPPEAEAEDDAE